MIDKNAVTKWVKAAIADGWDHSPTYPNEAEEQAVTLDKDGFVAMAYDRPETDLLKAHSNIFVWGPDGWQVNPVTEYSWDALVAGLRTCEECGATDVEATRFSFAGRMCLACREKMREPEGWTA